MKSSLLFFGVVAIAAGAIHPGAVYARDAGSGSVTTDAAEHTVTMTDGSRNLVMRLNYSRGCVLDEVLVGGREVIAAGSGAYTGIESGGQWSTTLSAGRAPAVSVTGNQVDVDGINLGGGVTANEHWTFTVKSDRIDWSITRNYISGGEIDDTYLPVWDFADRNTWTGGLLDTGGIAWCHLLGDKATYGAHARAVTFWKPGEAEALQISSTPAGGLNLASRFTQQPSGVFMYVQSASAHNIIPKHGLRRFMSPGLDLWAPIPVQSGTQRVLVTVKAVGYDATFGRGDFKGIDSMSTTQLLNTIGRYGAIDRRIVSGNGWVTGFVCLDEPFYGALAAAVDDPNYTANLASSLDDWRDHAIKPDGRVMARWVYENGMDNMVPNTYDPATGYYDCGWGCSLDAQPDYPIDVAETFNLSGNLAWLRGHKDSCERALDWMLARDTDSSGLVQMMTDSRKDRKSSDWIDIVFACYKDALVNALMYEALSLWADREVLLGDKVHEAQYRAAALKLKTAFIQPVSKGGFWNPDKGYFDHWLEKDGSAHGDNLVIPVNFCAVAYGLCSDAQKKSVLDNIATRMNAEKLFHWPLCFTSYASDECMGQQPFPQYENGDIFLSWGEVGVRAYASYDPAIAVKYVRAVLAKYQTDGLAFQRYLRASQQGAGADILAGNSMTIAGLYRDIYGIQPQWNRLLLDPHITPDLAGTRIRYLLRGRWYDIRIDAHQTTVAVNGFTVHSERPFAVSTSGNELICYAGQSSQIIYKVTRSGTAKVEVTLKALPPRHVAVAFGVVNRGKPNRSQAGGPVVLYNCF